MTEDQKDIGRRDFVVSVTAGLAAATASAAGLEVVESDVSIKTPDGTCDAAFIRPKTGTHAGVLLWPDAFGLRPWTREMGRRLAAEGYSVLVPNPFYRLSKAPFTDASTFNFANQADMAKLRPLMASVNAAGAAEKDATAYIAFLDAQRNQQVPEDRHPGLPWWTTRHEDCSDAPNRLAPGILPQFSNCNLDSPLARTESRRTCISESPPATTAAGYRAEAEGSVLAAKVPGGQPRRHPACGA
jgi:hypothetical protein